MKTTTLLSLLLMIAGCVQAQPTNIPTPEWKVTLKVVDDTGNPVAGAKATIISTNQIKGLTDTNGIFVASHRDKSFALAFDVKKAGYYSFWQRYEMGWANEYNYAKWNPTVKIILRKIGNPIPMYAKAQEMKFPKLDEPVGFDLMAGDWVTPYGKGFHTDLLFKAHREIKNDREYTAKLTVTFPSKGDGIIVALTEPTDGSEFKTARIAAETGYQPDLVSDYSNIAKPAPVFGYFIRVRTELSENGNVKSALYGKIAGNFRFYAGTIAPTSGMGFTYYLNPTPNDRNVEFNPKQNMIKDLKPIQEINEP